jgi:hypothetical protein
VKELLICAAIALGIVLVVGWVSLKIMERDIYGKR